MDRKLKTCIITLIEDDIVNYKLITSLSDIGIEASFYGTSSLSVICYLMELEDEENLDEWYEKYYSLIRNGKRIDVRTDRTIIQPMAIEVFYALKNS